MSSRDLLAILPLLIVAGMSVLLLLGIAVRRSHLLTAVLALLTLAAAFVSLWAAAPCAPRQVTALLLVDRYALFFMGLNLAASFVVVGFCYSYFEKQGIQREELYVLLLLAVAGALVLAATSHFASFFLGVELLSAPLFAMIAYLPARRLPLEAGLKYLILAAASVAFLLFGIALVYAELGTLEFGRMAVLLSERPSYRGTLLLPGLVLIVTGFGFKLAVVPFHLWAPDVYQGAPAPVSAFVATVSKAALFALLLRYFYSTGARAPDSIALLFTIVAIASMIAGNILALLQDNVKRILAYSSIAHLGYVLVAFLAGGELAASAVGYYLAAYIITILGAFGMISVLSTHEREPDAINDYRGLFWARPWLAMVFTVLLLSLAGIPMTAGFFAKYYVLAASAASNMWLLAIVLVATSAIGLFYYLRIISALYAEPAGPESLAVLRPAAASPALLLVILAVLVIWLGVYPKPLIDLIETTAATMVAR